MDPRWANINQLAEALASGLAPDAPFRMSAMSRASDLYKACFKESCPTSPAPAPVTRAFAGMASSLASLAATLARGPEARVLDRTTVVQCNSACMALSGALDLVERYQLQLPEQDCMRLLSAAATIPLNIVRRQLPVLLGHALATRGSNDILALTLSLEKASCVFTKMLQLTSQQPTPLPDRVAAAVQATHLSGSSLKLWTETAVAAAAGIMTASGSCQPPRWVPNMLRNMVATGTHPALRFMVQQDTHLQLSIVKLAALALVLPEEERVAAVQDPQRCLVLRDLAELAAAACLPAGRWLFEMEGTQRSRNNSRGATDGLLQGVAALAAQPQLQDSRGQEEQASLLLACLELLAALTQDAAMRVIAEAHVPLPHLKAVVQQLGHTALPLLCRLAGEVTQPAPGSFGAVCWASMASEWKVMLLDWGNCTSYLSGIKWELVSDDADCYAALIKAAEGLVCLAPLLPLQPGEQCPPGLVDSHGGGGPHGWRTVGWVLAQCSSAWRQELHHVVELPPSVRAAVQLAVAGMKAAYGCLVLPLPCRPDSRCDFPSATAAFHTTATACRYVQAFLTALQPSGGSSSSRSNAGSHVLAATYMTEAVARLMDNAALRAVFLGYPMADNCPVPEIEPQQQLRRVECCVLLYLQTLAALPPMHTWQCMPESLDEIAAERVATLRMMAHAELQLLQPLWRQLLSASGRAAAGLDVVCLIADTCRTAVGVRVRGSLMALDAAVDLMISAADLSLDALKVFTADTGLLKALSRAGRQHLVGALPFAQDTDQADLLHNYVVLLHRLVNQLPALNRGEVAQVQQALACMWIDAASGRAALDAFDQLVAGLPPPAAPAARPHLPPPAAEVRELAVRRAYALAERRCSNPRCANLAGVSEAAAKGRRCSGCRVARYCSQECSVADWKLHKLACKVLQEEAAGSRGA